LELAGQSAGRIASEIGGEAIGTVLEEGPDAEEVITKRITGVTYNELALQFAGGAKANLYALVSSFLNRQIPSATGAVVSTESDLDIHLRHEFHGALVTEFGVPTLAASPKSLGCFTLHLAPELAKFVSATGKYSDSSVIKAKPFQTAAFRIAIDGIEMKHVNKVEALTVKQKIAGIGERGEVLVEPLLVPDLVVTVPESFAQSFYGWFESFVIQGNNDTTQERAGTLQILSPTLQTVLFTIGFQNLGIYRIDRVPPAGNQPLTVKVTMYCERMTFAPDPSVVN